MPLTKLQFRPGINREITSYSNEGGWFDCDKVRFRYGFPEKIGGWLRLSATTFLGTCRALHPWVALDGSRYLGVGTHLKYYINEGGGYSDITPIRDTTAAGDVTFVAAANTLSAGISAVQTIIPLTSSTGFPPSGLIQIGSEQIRYATVTGNDLEGVTRGVNGTIPAAHLSAAAVDCATLTVSDTGHGALDNDFVTFSGAVSLGSQITAAILNQEYQIVSIVDVDSYLIEARAVASIPSITTSSGLNPTPVFADSSDSGTGGASVVGAYQINTGLDTTITGNGWGAGTWGRGTWGSGASLLVVGIAAADLEPRQLWRGPALQRAGRRYFLLGQEFGDHGPRGCFVFAVGASSTPTVAKQIMVSDTDRHVIAFGCDSEASPGVQDPLLIRFSSQESLTDWAAHGHQHGGRTAPRLWFADCHGRRDASADSGFHRHLALCDAVSWAAVYLWCAVDL
jgi:hypothetical protein